jgi:ankyrin repeat protein
MAQGDKIEALAHLVDLTCNFFAEQEAAEGGKEDNEGIDGEPSLAASSSSVMRNEEDSLSIVSHHSGAPTGNETVNAYLNQPSVNKSTPLHLAVMNNAIGVVNFLLLHKVNLDAQDSSGDTPMHKAGRNGLHRIYELLLEAGGSDSIKNNFGESPHDMLIDNPSY